MTGGNGREQDRRAVTPLRRQARPSQGGAPPGRARSGHVRPEAAATLRRWAEPAAAGALAALCLALAGRKLWAAPDDLLGWPLLLVGGAFATWFWAALQRARLDEAGAGDPGPGVVVIDERRISYLGPFDGGLVALESLRAIDVESGPRPAWALRLDDGRTLRIPAAAEGADALPEAFAALPGFSPARAAHALAARGTATFPVWRR